MFYSRLREVILDYFKIVTDLVWIIDTWLFNDTDNYGRWDDKSRYKRIASGFFFFGVKFSAEI